MKQIAVLGPKGTYCEMACRKYLSDENLNYEIEYYPTILKTMASINNDRLAIVPFENTLDGFVMESMDSMIINKYYVIDQVKLNIDFAFVTNAKSISDVKHCFVQFKAKGQCLDFLMNKSFEILQTESNMESLELVKKSDLTYSAIIPMHSLADSSFNIVIPHVADSSSNETRFFVLDKNPNYHTSCDNLCSSIVVTAKVDRPGILYDILKNFHDLNINLKSLMSRPMKTEMGKYRFYIECSLDYEQIKKLEKLSSKLLDDKEFDVDVLGIYKDLG